MPAAKNVLATGQSVAALYRRDELIALDRDFVAFLGAVDPALRDRLTTARADSDALEATAESQLLIELAPHLEDFVGELFGITKEVRELQARHDALAPVHTVKRLFVQRRAIKGKTPDQVTEIDGPSLAVELAEMFGEPLAELSFAVHVARWLDDESTNAAALELASCYAAWATLTPAGRAAHHDGVLFKQPHKLDMSNLVPVEKLAVEGVSVDRYPPAKWRPRDGFGLTDPGTDLLGALDQANYCIWCHEQGKDSCSHGVKEKKSGTFQKSVFGATLAGCPLEEKISEMNLVKASGHSLGALAIAIVDNPMVAATGHRICNDCMKACIYQKQEPVDIPQIETRTLKDVLALPWGFEIYSLLTRWNPLNLRRPVPRADTGYKVLVVGLGPAGFTLAHHLMNDGHTVVGIDGLKIEPLPAALSGIDVSGRRHPFRPVRDIAEIRESLDDRLMAGFGGVAEYGITVRWDKNFLKIIRLLLERRDEFTMFGGVRFGGTITADDAFALGFDHIALCVGAGRPTIVPMKNGLARGVRQASDFLMALQLSGAAKTDSLANLTVRLPVVVIGGGLTAIDTATEALAYYAVQVEKFLARNETLVAKRGEAAVRADWSEEEAATAAEFIVHARALRAERVDAAREKRPPLLAQLIDSWGGVTIAYRRRLVDAPSYTLNHEEVAKAMEEGIRFAEMLTPEEIVLDARGAAKALILSRSSTSERSGERVTLPARTILIAAGTQPNTVLGQEDPDTFVLDGRHFGAVTETGAPVRPDRLPKPAAAHVLTHIRTDGRAISFFGDLHPSFAGNVVKAMASAKQGYPVISRMLNRCRPSEPAPDELVKKLNASLRPRVLAVNTLAPRILEVVIRAPMAAHAFQPGQFYRLQNYETCTPRAAGTLLAMEGLALTGAWVDRERGLVATIVLEMGGSSNLCRQLRPGEPVVLMGPTGMPTELPVGKTVLLVGGGLGNAVLFSIGQALRERGSRVLYAAAYRKLEDRYKAEEIEKAADSILWCCEEAPGFLPTRPQDHRFVGNVLAALVEYGAGRLGTTSIALCDVDHMIVIGSDRMMAAMAAAKNGILKPYLKPDVTAVASINSPMQCMMKEICGQCLQAQRDPQTGAETIVFSCCNQDQALARVDFSVLRDRLAQNSLAEKMTTLWLSDCLKPAPAETPGSLHSSKFGDLSDTASLAFAVAGEP
jgi:NADPH-dependent glutamate synthase beta subunit-like oxidoreductase/NAD(P)H-flavin reductase